MEIEVIFTVVLFLLFTLIGRLFYKNYMNPISMMCGVWAIILFAYSFHAYDIYYATEQSILLIAVGISMFFAGGVVATGINQKSITSTSFKLKPNSSRPNYNLLICLNVLSILVIFVSFLSTIQLLRSGVGFNFIARYYGTEEGTLGQVQRGYELQQFVVWPICLGTSPIAVVSFLCDKKKTKRRMLFLISFLINTSMFIVITGKRINMVCIIIYFIILMRLIKKSIKLTLKTKLLIAFGIAGIIFAFNYITVSRGSISIFRTIYIYLCGCVPCLAAKLENIPVNYQYGLLSFHGLYRAPLMILNYFLRSSVLLSIRRMVSEVINFTQVPVHISSSTTYNAFVSPFFYFYVDLGWVGVIIYSFIYGYFCARIYILLLQKGSYKYLALYLLVSFSLFMSMVRFHFVQMRYSLAFFYLLIPFFFRFRVYLSFKENADSWTLR